MAYGFEVVLGWKYNDFQKLCKSINLPKKLDIENYELRGVLKEYNKEKFKKAYSKALMFVNSKRKPQHNGMFLDLFFDPLELEQQQKDAIVGVALTNRYDPVLLDLVKSTNYELMIDECLLDLVKNVKELLSEDVDMLFAQANTYVILVHY